MRKLTTIITAGAMAFAMQTSATDIQARVSLGNKVSQANYRDYLVHILTDNGRCGAQIIASKWLLTAKHCVKLIDGGANDGDKQEVIVYQGLELLDRGNIVYAGDATLHGNNNTINDQELAVERYFSEHLTPIMESIYREYDDETGFDYVPNGDESFYEPLQVNRTHYDDMALLELERPIAHKHTAIITPGFKFHLVDTVTSQAEFDDLSMVDIDATFTFRGWGVSGIRNPEEDPEELRAIPITLNTEPLQLDCIMIGYNGVQSEDASCFESDQHIIDTYDSAIFYTYRSWYTSYVSTYTAAQAAQEGDSGTGLYNSKDELIALAVRVGGIYPTSYNKFEMLTHHWDYILNTVNDLNAPKVISEEVEAAGQYQASYDVRIQNLSPTDIAVTPYLMSGTYFQITGNTCPQLLSEGDDCTVTITGGSKHFIKGQAETDILFYNTEKFTNVSFSVKPDYIEVPVEEPENGCDVHPDACESEEEVEQVPPTPAKKKSGGSMGWFSLLGLVALIRLRK